MFKKAKKILSVTLCLVMLGSTVIFSDSFVDDKSTSEAVKDSGFLFKVDGYIFKYENAPKELKDRYDNTCKELGIIPNSDSEIFVPMDEMYKYQKTYNLDDSISTYADFSIYFHNTYFEVTGSKNYKVYITQYVGYGHETSGNSVHLVQLLLKRVGYSLDADGLFGSDTYNKVRSFQSRYGLNSDGVVGIGTWNKFVDVLKL
ncbi:peptidoglycan-binding domain-containing protein [Clostridioides sp. ES-S-0001-02]|uniref:peptidoglycan-binding domain-containing protein n=1 Tax=Clostridioides sp. ES-S-0001-02 TaxID=2770770 RepID=UPI001D10F140|nr:peptidoglycan-binding protein [Clostridioides sp. ES-S-0001-02]